MKYVAISNGHRYLVKSGDAAYKAIQTEAAATYAINVQYVICDLNEEVITSTRRNFSSSYMRVVSKGSANIAAFDLTVPAAAEGYTFDGWFNTDGELVCTKTNFKGNTLTNKMCIVKYTTSPINTQQINMYQEFAIEGPTADNKYAAIYIAHFDIKITSQFTGVMRTSKEGEMTVRIENNTVVYYLNGVKDTTNVKGSFYSGSRDNISYKVNYSYPNNTLPWYYRAFVVYNNGQVEYSPQKQIIPNPGG